MKKLITLLAIILVPFCLSAQNTVGKSKQDIRKIIQSNPNFKLLAGKDCDTLDFTQGMQAIFDYKNDICYKSISVMPLKYMSSVTGKMTADSYKKISDNTWIDSNETIKVFISIDKIKNLCFVTTTSYEK